MPPLWEYCSVESDSGAKPGAYTPGSQNRLQRRVACVLLPMAPHPLLLRVSTVGRGPMRPEVTLWRFFLAGVLPGSEDESTGHFAP